MTGMKYHKYLFAIGLLCAALAMPACRQKLAYKARPDLPGKGQRATEQYLQWWRDARFGMFIHWGPVSLKGTEISWSRGREVPVETYDNLYKQFNPTEFDAAEWVNIAEKAGMKYIVITSKHHDGFSIFDSEHTNYDIMSTPFKRDVIADLAKECKRRGIRLCFYYSILDWYHPDYIPRGEGDKRPTETAVLERYITFMKSQLRELLTNYGPIGILWFDGEWDSTWTHEHGEDLYAYVKGLQPDIIINNRVGKGRQAMQAATRGNGHPGDYDTPEQQIGKFQIDRPWETCMTLCEQWAWKPDDTMKSLKQCIRTLVCVAGGDGNFLFNVGPMPDGRIEPRQADRLLAMGRWLDKYGRSIYGTRGGPFKPRSWIACTHRKNTIYIHVLDWLSNPIILPPIDRKIVGAGLLAGGKAAVKQTDHCIEISVPTAHHQDIDTIVALKLDGPAGDIAPVDIPPVSLTYGKEVSASNIWGL